jgi:hypothetical protein
MVVGVDHNFIPVATTFRQVDETNKKLYFSSLSVFEFSFPFLFFEIFQLKDEMCTAPELVDKCFDAELIGLLLNGINEIIL